MRIAIYLKNIKESEKKYVSPRLIGDCIDIHDPLAAGWRKCGNNTIYEVLEGDLAATMPNVNLTQIPIENVRCIKKVMTKKEAQKAGLISIDK